MYETTGRRLLHAAALAVAALSASHAVTAQNYPDRPIRVIVPFAGGSASDVLARLVTERLATGIGTPVVIDNRPGAGGNIGTVAAARAEPDGYTLLMNGLPLAVNKLLLKDPGFDVEKDFEPIVLYAIVPNIIVVNAKLPINSISPTISSRRLIHAAAESPVASPPHIV